MAKTDNKEKLFTLPIRACDIFRILSTRTVAEHPDLMTEFAKDDFLKRFFDAIETSKRITTTSHANFLNYGKEGHQWIPGYPSRLRSCAKMSEQQLCKYKTGFKSCDDKTALGKFVDYQVPLNTAQDSGEGKIDLLSQSHRKKTIYVIEAKGIKSNEHPLRAFFEALTFWRMMVEKAKVESGNAKRFVKRYNDALKHKKWPEAPTTDLELEYALKPAILLYKKSPIWTKLKTCNDERLKKIYSALSRYVDCFEYDLSERNAKMTIAKMGPQS